MANNRMKSCWVRSLNPVRFRKAVTTEREWSFAITDVSDRSPATELAPVVPALLHCETPLIIGGAVTRP